MYVFILVYEVMEFLKMVMESHGISFPDLCGNPVNLGVTGVNSFNMLFNYIWAMPKNTDFSTVL